LITAILREGKIVVPKGDTELNSGDEILVLTTPENEKILERKLSS
jgi:Trk K+ transport system NAD-binding subunit